MLNKADILLFLKNNKAYLRNQFFVEKIGIFGSFARDEANAKSDIDFLAEINAPLEIYRQNKQALHEYLRNAFGREIDIANPNSIKQHFKQKILKQAVYA